MLSRGMLRAAGSPTLQGPFYGISQADVDWEAHFFDAADTETGWVVAFRDQHRHGRGATRDPTRASGRSSGAHRGRGSSGWWGEPVRPSDPHQSWAGRRAQTVAMVGLPGQRDVRRPTTACRRSPRWEGADGGRARGAYLDPVRGQPGHRPARRGPQRPVHPDAAGWRDARLCPTRTTVGWRTRGPAGSATLMTDPPTAAQLALEHRLPFATCA